ncbi:MAG: hypothetical protein OEZ06_01505 [Myxococcales bacterium]|nr:hypothetical protein [Myxococcales bacterium]
MSKPKHWAAFSRHAAVFCLAACGATAAQRSDSAEPTAGLFALPSSRGTSPEQPAAVCGVREAYQLVADHRCSDRSQPLGGDPEEGRRARAGSMGSHQASDGVDLANSHIVDRYRVPCSDGVEEVFVCLYHCPVGRSPLD